MASLLGQVLVPSMHLDVLLPALHLLIWMLLSLGNTSYMPVILAVSKKTFLPIVSICAGDDCHYVVSCCQHVCPCNTRCIRQELLALEMSNYAKKAMSFILGILSTLNLNKMGTMLQFNRSPLPSSQEILLEKHAVLKIKIVQRFLVLVLQKKFVWLSSITTQGKYFL